MENNYKELAKVLIDKYFDVANRNGETDFNILKELLYKTADTNNTGRIKKIEDVKNISDLASFIVQLYIHEANKFPEQVSTQMALQQFKNEIKNRRPIMKKTEKQREEVVEEIKPIDIPLIKPPKEKYKIPNLEDLDNKKIEYDEKFIKRIAAAPEAVRQKLLEGTKVNLIEEVNSEVAKQREERIEQIKEETMKTL